MATTRMIFPAILLALFLTASTGYSFTALYAFAGGAGYGTVFSLSLGSASAPAPQLTILRASTNMILSWTATGFILQSTTNLDPPVVWAPIASGQNSATNPISGTRKFYRLSQ